MKDAFIARERTHFHVTVFCRVLRVAPSGFYACCQRAQRTAADITYLPTRQRWMYLAVVIHLRTRQVLGYCPDETMNDTLVCRALIDACVACPAVCGTLLHSDQGSQYHSQRFCWLLTAYGLVASMSRRGNCWDNAVVESFFASLKTEEAQRPYDSKAHAHQAIACYIHGFYNTTRLHSALGYRSANAYAREGQRIIAA